MVLNSLQRRFTVLALTTLLLLVVGCSSSPRALAPVEDRSTGSPVQTAAPAVPVAGPSAATKAPNAPNAVPEKNLPGAENAGKPGYYTVRQGDTLTRIGLENGQAWRDLAKWNNLENPNLIEVGQVIRIAPPNAAVESAGVVVRPVVNTGVPEVKATAANAPLDGVSKSAALPGASAAAPAAPASVSPAAPVPPVDEGLGFMWPASGPLLAGFDEAKNKGLDIGGKSGDPVVASADGQVVYAGAGLRGYGNLLILKHNNTYLTAYAHNQALLVKEDQKVKKGQKIAEMGSSDSTNGVKLHFEIRRQGKPVDPAKLLPTR
jgi:lipoprotein NlpD